MNVQHAGDDPDDARDNFFAFMRGCPNMSNDLFSLHSMFDLAPGAASVA